MTENKRFSMVLSPELEKKILDMRRREEYCRLSLSEIARQMLLKGLEAEAAEQAGT